MFQVFIDYQRPPPRPHVPALCRTDDDRLASEDHGDGTRINARETLFHCVFKQRENREIRLRKANVHDDGEDVANRFPLTPLTLEFIEIVEKSAEAN